MKINQLITKLQQIKNQDAIIKMKVGRDVDAIANDIEEFLSNTRKAQMNMHYTLLTIRRRLMIEILFDITGLYIMLLIYQVLRRLEDDDK